MYYLFNALDSLHPLCNALFFFMAGIYGASHILISASLAFIFLLVCILFRSKKIFLCATYYCVFLGGITLQLWKHHQLEHFFLSIDSKKSYVIKGTVAALQELQGKKYAYFCILKDASLIEDSTQSVVAHGVSLGLYSNKIGSFEIDDVISITTAKIKKPASISYQYYLFKENIVATTFLSHETNLALIQRPNASLSRWIFNKRKAIVASLRKKMLPQTFTFFSSLFLGYKQSTSSFQNLKDHFKLWGLSHYLARSGLHLVLFIAVLQAFFCLIPISFIIKRLCIAFLVLIYFFLSWTSIPFTRSCFTYVIYLIYTLFNKQINPLHILTLVAWLILLTNPMHLFALDFQLSFGLTFALIWFSQIPRLIQQKHISLN